MSVIYLPCGYTAESMLRVDDNGRVQYVYACKNCQASESFSNFPIWKDMSPHCKELIEKYESWRQLGGKGWDYSLGCEK